MGPVPILYAIFFFIGHFLRRFSRSVANHSDCLLYLRRNSRNFIVACKNCYIFALRKNDDTTSQQKKKDHFCSRSIVLWLSRTENDRFEVQIKQSINNKKNKIMKTMELTPMTVAQYNNAAMTEKVMKAVKNALKNTLKFLMFISPIYLQATQNMK